MGWCRHRDGNQSARGTSSSDACVSRQLISIACLTTLCGGSMTSFILKSRGMLFAALLCLLGFAPAVRAQSAVDGAVGGNVLDSTGAVVANAEVTVVNLGTNAQQKVATDASGYFRVIHLQPGPYEVKIAAS